ncbi:LCP family protein [Aerococcaceae bacterium NML191219]|nr:LCP family protein [Aerococcaceae bacterium NML191219]
MDREERLSTRSARKRRKRRKKRGFLPFVVGLLLLIILGTGIYVYSVYRNLQETAQDLHSSRPAEQIAKRSESVEVTQKHQPFSVLLLGIDTGEFDRGDEGGRSDVMIVATINKQNKRVTFTSIPRDTRTEIVGYGIEDKINHAYAFGGVAMSVNSVQNLLDIPIDYTVTIDMGGFEKIIDAVGGITVTPFSTFNQEGYQFYEGQPVHMDGVTALQYSRFRFDDDGDYGRQERQRQIITALIKSLASPDTLFSYGNILDSLQGVITTDMTFNEITSVVQNYHQAAQNIETLQLSGSGTTIDGVYYDIPDPSSLREVSNRIKSELEIN